jgi:type I restriction enzyme S subunit
MFPRPKIEELIASGAIIAIQDGNHGEKHPTSADYVAQGIPFLMARDFCDSRVDLESAIKIPKTLGDSLRVGFSIEGDVLLTHKGTVGLVAVVPPIKDYVMLTPQVTYYRTNPGKLINLYLKYAFQAPFFRDQLGSLSGQSTRPYIGITAQKKLRVDFPSLPIQRRIAGILSAHDELIENSQRRIKILEEMARALYREWFVHFRFPGHESVPRVPSLLGEIPQGWQVLKLGDVCSLTMGQSPKSEFYNEIGEGIAFHQGVTDFGDRFPSNRLFCTAEGRVAEPGDILFSVRAPVGRMNIADKRLMLGRGLSAIRHRENFQAFLWEQLRSHFTRDDMIGNGAIFASVTKDDMRSINLLCPPRSLIAAATRHFDPLHSEIETLSRQIENLRRTRESLLPRLLSGQIELGDCS